MQRIFQFSRVRLLKLVKVEALREYAERIISNRAYELDWIFAVQLDCLPRFERANINYLDDAARQHDHGQKQLFDDVKALDVLILRRHQQLALFYILLKEWVDIVGN